MTLTTKDFEALRLLIREEVGTEVQKAVEPLRLLIREEVRDASDKLEQRLNHRLDDINKSLDVLFTRDQEREREYLVLNKKISA